MAAAPPTTPQPIPGVREFVVMLAMIQALQALAIDAMLPALGAMSAELGVGDSNHRQLVIGIFLLFSGLGSLVPGSLADRFGRRPVLIVCLSAYIGLTLACALATQFAMLLVLRALIGLASSGLAVLPGAIIRDRFEGDRMARLQSMISMVFMIVPMIAPAIGQGVLLIAGWRWIFGVMALLGGCVLGWIFLRLPETLRPEFRQTIQLRAIIGNMHAAVTNRGSIGYVFGMALVQGGLFGYINSSQQLVAEHFGAGRAFPLFFGGMAMAMALSNFTNSRIVEHFGARRVSQAALLIYIVVSLTQLALAQQPGEPLWQFVPLMTVNLCLMGFIGANFGAIALQPFARIAGAAASVQAFIRTVAAASLGALIGQAYDGSARPLALALVLAGSGALLLVLFSERGRLFRRLNPPADQQV